MGLEESTKTRPPANEVDSAPKYFTAARAGGD
jgi:hypothetical protein